MFENILRNNPKRTDLWSVYLDQVNARFLAFKYYFICCVKFKAVIYTLLYHRGRKFDLEIAI